MRAIINPDGINSGNALEKTSCCLTLEKLREMYVEKKLSSGEIATYCQDLGFASVDYCRVKKWLMLAGIPRRTLKEAGKLLAEKYPDKYKALGFYAYQCQKKPTMLYPEHRAKIIASNLKHRQKFQKLGQDAAAKKRRERNSFCFCSQCHKQIRIPFSQLIFNTHFCSRQCYSELRKSGFYKGTRWNNAQKQLLKEIEAIKQQYREVGE